MLSLFQRLIFLNYFELKLYEILLGWFLAEYVYEEYFLTAGNLFFSLADFRSLIANFVLVFQEIILKFYLILFCKYLILVLILWSVFKLKNHFSKKFLFKCFIYNLICYFLYLNIYYVNTILVFYTVSHFSSQFSTIKFIFYLFICLFLFTFLAETIIEFNFITNNCFQEIGLKTLFVYSYIYYLK